MIENLKRTLVPDIAPHIRIIKALPIADKDDFQRAGQYEGMVDFFLFDTKCSTKGGSGNRFDWGLLSAYQGQTPFLLSGGIGPEDAEAIRRIDHPQFAGIDVNSRFETSPGVKDVEKLRSFVEVLRNQ